MTTHSSILAWKIPWIEEPGGLQPIGLQTVRQNQSNSACTHTFSNKETSSEDNIKSPSNIQLKILGRKQFNPSAFKEIAKVFQFSSVQSLSRVRLFATP